jgi:dCMP deaminase
MVFKGTPKDLKMIVRHEAGLTKSYVLHAEANAITQVAKSGNNSLGATLNVTTSPCIECSKLIYSGWNKKSRIFR